MRRIGDLQYMFEFRIYIFTCIKKYPNIGILNNIRINIRCRGQYPNTDLKRT